MFKCYCLEILIFLNQEHLVFILLWVPQTTGPRLVGRCLDITVLHHSFLHLNTVLILSRIQQYQDELEVSRLPSLFMSFEIAAWCPQQSWPWKCFHLTRAHLCPAFYIMGFETKYVPTSICRCISDNYASVIYVGTFFLKEIKRLTDRHVFFIKRPSSLEPQISILGSSKIFLQSKQWDPLEKQSRTLTPSSCPVIYGRIPWSGFAFLLPWLEHWWLPASPNLLAQWCPSVNANLTSHMEPISTPNPPLLWF